MEKTLLWEAFATLTPAELRDLDKFVRSPFFNAKAQLTGLFEYLCACRAGNRLPDSASAFAGAYPQHVEYEDAKMRLANSDLLRLIEQYWLFQEKFSDAARNEIQLAGAYRKRNLPRHFNATLREARRRSAVSPWRHSEFFDLQNALEWEQFQFASAGKRYEDFNLQEISDFLDLTFIARKLRHICIARSHSAVTGKLYRMGLSEAIFAHVESEGLLRYPAVALYFHAEYFMADPAAEDHFFTFREILTRDGAFFPEEELRALYLLALNFGIKKSNAAADTGTRWHRQTLELYREALERNLLLENGNLSRFAYNNIVGIAIRVGETDWAEQFAHQYKPQLERKFREAAFSLNLARIAYERGDYAKALPLLQHADYKDLISSMNAKILQLKIYYESAENELLESHLESIKNYLRRQRAAGYHLENYTKIIHFTRVLMRLNPKDKAGIEKVRTEILETTTLSEREWLLTQVDALAVF
jgi:hypothetical protein